MVPVVVVVVVVVNVDKVAAVCEVIVKVSRVRMTTTFVDVVVVG